MTEEQAKALKVGDKVRYIGPDEDYLKIGETYEIKGRDRGVDPYVIDNDGDEYGIYGMYCEEFELATSPYSVKNVATWPASDDGLTHIEADVNKAMLDFMRGIEKDQARETKRQAIREQIAKLEAELEAL